MRAELYRHRFRHSVHSQAGFKDNLKETVAALTPEPTMTSMLVAAQAWLPHHALFKKIKQDPSPTVANMKKFAGIIKAHLAQYRQLLSLYLSDLDDLKRQQVFLLVEKQPEQCCRWLQENLPEFYQPQMLAKALDINFFNDNNRIIAFLKSFFSHPPAMQALTGSLDTISQQLAKDRKRFCNILYKLADTPAKCEALVAQYAANLLPEMIQLHYPATKFKFHTHWNDEKKPHENIKAMITIVRDRLEKKDRQFFSNASDYERVFNIFETFKTHSNDDTTNKEMLSLLQDQLVRLCQNKFTLEELLEPEGEWQLVDINSPAAPTVSIDHLLKFWLIKTQQEITYQYDLQQGNTYGADHLNISGAK